MKKLLLAMTLSLLVGVAAYAVPIDISNATVTITGPTTFTMNHIAAFGGSYWCDFVWNETRFDVVDYGEETGAGSAAGTWTLNYYWNGTCTMYLYEDGTGWIDEGYAITWYQDGYDVEWFFESGTHYWGTINEAADYMEGEMLSAYGSTGTWDAFRIAAAGPRIDECGMLIAE